MQEKSEIYFDLIQKRLKKYVLGYLCLKSLCNIQFCASVVKIFLLFLAFILYCLDKILIIKYFKQNLTTIFSAVVAMLENPQSYLFRKIKVIVVLLHNKYIGNTLFDVVHCWCC